VSLSKLHFAIRGRRPQEALAIYDALRYVPARYLCRLALLLGETGHPRYEEIARALIVSVTRELEPEILQIKKFADALAHIDDAAWWWAARDAVQNVIAQLHRKWRKLNVDFNSLP